MSTDHAPASTYCYSRAPSNPSLPLGSLKRKFGFLVPPVPRTELSYPSPPMSNPSSPPRHVLDSSMGAVRYQPSQIASALKIDCGQPLDIPSSSLPFHSAPHPPFFDQGTHGPPFGAPPRAQLTPLLGLPGLQARQSVAIPPQSGPHATGPPTTRSSRKSKAHVASACINCKKAHLSCDVQRPCARCVASGKQDTCYDVQHKKRGRPRLREETEYKVEQLVTDPRRQPTTPSGAGHLSSRPSAGTKHRTSESFRSIRSQASDGMPPGHAFQSTGYAPHPPALSFGYQPAAPHMSHLTAFEIPTALLDMDFVFIRANRPFQQVMSGGFDVRGRHLSDVAAPANHEDLQCIRNGLRSEREAREPLYMPPILMPGHDPIQGVSEADVDRLSQGFTDRTYIWRRSRTEPVSETFPARVRLAKANTYFVVVTLPSFQPIQYQQPPPQYNLPCQLASPYPGPNAIQYSYPTHGGPTTPTITSRTHSELSAAAGFPVQSPQLPHRQSVSFTTSPSLPPVESRADTALFTPRTSLTDLGQTGSRSTVQLPPIQTTLASVAAEVDSAKSVQSARSESQQGPPSEGGESGDGELLRKRRRMGIDEVLQKD